jgi:hypothetical protein
MNSSEIKSEIAKLEAEAKQIIANSHFLNGAIRAWNIMLSKVEEKEKSVEQKIVSDLEKNDKSAETPST